MSRTLINTMRNADGVVVVEIRGEVDVAEVERLQQLLTDATRQLPTAIVVDLLYVTFIDSTGIGALVAGHNAARALGVPYRVRGASPFIVDRLQQIGLDGLLMGQSS